MPCINTTDHHFNLYLNQRKKYIPTRWKKIERFPNYHSLSISIEIWNWTVFFSHHIFLFWIYSEFIYGLLWKFKTGNITKRWAKRRKHPCFISTIYSVHLYITLCIEFKKKIVFAAFCSSFRQGAQVIQETRGLILQGHRIHFTLI